MNRWDVNNKERYNLLYPNTWNIKKNTPMLQSLLDVQSIGWIEKSFLLYLFFCISLSWSLSHVMFRCDLIRSSPYSSRSTLYFPPTMFIFTVRLSLLLHRLFLITCTFEFLSKICIHAPLMDVTLHNNKC